MATEERSQLARCAAHGLTYDPRVASGCVLCRRSSVPGPAASTEGTGSRAGVLVAVLFFVSAAAAAAYHFEIVDRLLPGGGAKHTSRSADEPPLRPGEVPSIEEPLRTTNAWKRSGVVFVPARQPGDRLPALVGLHGQGGDGQEMIEAFRSLAIERRFAIIAPSSSYGEEIKSFSWRVGDKPNDFTDDYRHIGACLDEVLHRTDVTIDTSHVLIAGFSGGASSAPYVATNTAPYEAFAVLHGGVFIGGIGARKVHGWFSTGESDSARPPNHVFGHFNSMRSAGFETTYKTYPGGHVLSMQERKDLVAWWLGEPQ